MQFRLKWAGVLLGAALLAAAGAYRWPLSSTFVGAEFGQQLTDTIGLALRGPARAYLTILPLPTLHLVDVELGGKDGAAVITAPIAKVQLALLPLTMGRLQFTGAFLRRPTVLVDLDRPPFGRNGVLARLIASKNSAFGETPLGVLRFEGGLLHIVSAENGLDTLIQDVAGELDWPRFVDAARLDLHATWRGAPTAITARLDEPTKWLIGDGSALHFDLSSPVASLRLDGALKPGDSGVFEGALAADVGSAAALTRIFGQGPTPPVLDGRLTLAAKAALSVRSQTLSEMRLQAAGQNFDGALALSHAPKGWSISGSVAAETVKLDELFAMAPGLTDENGDWSDKPLPFDAFAGLALDLRASIGKTIWRGHVLEDSALSFMVHDGAGAMTLSDATVYKGQLTGKLAFAPGAQGFDVTASASLANANIGVLTADFGSTGYSGQGGGEFEVRASGASPAALIKTLSGKASVKLGPGVIEGLSFEEALRRSERRPINLFADMRTGRTVFNEAGAVATIDRGLATLRTAAVIGPGVLITLQGGANLADRDIATEIIATQADQHGAPDPAGPQIKVTISGPWSHPTIKSDTGA